MEDFCLKGFGPEECSNCGFKTNDLISDTNTYEAGKSLRLCCSCKEMSSLQFKNKKLKRKFEESKEYVLKEYAELFERLADR